VRAEAQPRPRLGRLEDEPPHRRAGQDLARPGGRRRISPRKRVRNAGQAPGGAQAADTISGRYLGPGKGLSAQTRVSGPGPDMGEDQGQLSGPRPRRAVRRRGGVGASGRLRPRRPSVRGVPTAARGAEPPQRGAERLARPPARRAHSVSRARWLAAPRRCPRRSSLTQPHRHRQPRAPVRRRKPAVSDRCPRTTQKGQIDVSEHSHETADRQRPPGIRGPIIGSAGLGSHRPRKKPEPDRATATDQADRPTDEQGASA